MEGGNFDLKGLAEFGVKAALGKFDLGNISDHVVPMVGPILDEFKIPQSLSMGPVETLFIKAMIYGIDAQKERTRLADVRRAEDELQRSANQ